MAQITLNSTGVASSGALVLQSNGTTTAVTISTGQVATLEKDAVVNGLTVGRGAGAVSTNTAFGASALTANTTGSNNTAMGVNALAANVDGYSNSAYGPSALLANTSGYRNNAFGKAALTSNTTGNTNNAFGEFSLNSNTTGASNVAMGHQSLYSNTTGNNNTAIGYQAGYSNTTSATNAFLGAYSGYSTTGASNTFVGISAGEGVTSGAKNTIVGRYNGNSGGLDIRTASNYIVLSDGDGNPVVYSSGAGSWTVNNVTSAANAELILARGSTARWYIWNDGTTNNFNIVPASFTSGVTLTPSATSWSAFSDRRIKSNIVDLDYGLDTIMAIQPRRYTVIANGENSIGFIAQELKTVLPEAVVGEEIEFDDADTPQERSSKTMGIAKDHIIPVLVKAIQELKAEFDAYKEAHP